MQLLDEFLRSFGCVVKHDEGEKEEKGQFKSTMEEGGITKELVQGKRMAMLGGFFKMSFSLLSYYCYCIERARN